MIRANQLFVITFASMVTPFCYISTSLVAASWLTLRTDVSDRGSTGGGASGGRGGGSRLRHLGVGGTGDAVPVLASTMYGAGCGGDHSALNGSGFSAGAQHYSPYSSCAAGLCSSAAYSTGAPYATGVGFSVGGAGAATKRIAGGFSVRGADKVLLLIGLSSCLWGFFILLMRVTF